MMTSQEAHQEAERMYEMCQYYCKTPAKDRKAKSDKFYEAYLKLLKLADKLKDQAQ